MTNNIEDLTTKLKQDKELKKGARSVYKVDTDKHKGEQLKEDIQGKLNALKEIDLAGAVDWSNLEEVKQRTYLYIEACGNAEVFPSVMGLAVYGLGISRQALNQYLQRNDNPSTRFINQVKDIFADILTNASLYNNANSIQAIFQLKNHFGHSDTVQFEAIPPIKKEQLSDIEIESIRDKYL